MSDSVFPSTDDIEVFKSEFGAESILRRLTILRQTYCLVQAGTVIMPANTKDETLSHAWELVRSIANWVLVHSSELPPTEKYEIIIGWSKFARKLQGQIFKVNGDHSAIQEIANSTDWKQFEHTLYNRWEQDVFANRAV